MINPYAVMYDAEMSISRYRDVETEGFTGQKLTLLASNRPCRYSSSGQVPAGIPNPAIQNSHKLFCGLDEDVKEGDAIEVTLRTGKTVKLKLGECHPYMYQWQCEAERDDNA